jgi:hypothetical protein
MGALRHCCAEGAGISRFTGRPAGGVDVVRPSAWEFGRLYSRAQGATVLYHDISLVSVLGLRGTLHVQEAGDAEGVSVQAEGPYEAKVADGCWLIIYPEGHEPPIPAWFRAHLPVTAGQMDVGAVDVIAKARFLTDSVPRVRTRASLRLKSTVRITAPPGTGLELIDCQGRRKGPHGRWHLMQGKCRLDIR